VQDFAFVHLELTRGSDGDGNLGAITRGGGGGLNRGNNIHTLNHSTKDDMTSIQPRGLDGRDKELRSVRVLARVGHAQDTGTGVTELEVLVLKLGAINRLATSAVSSSEITLIGTKNQKKREGMRITKDLDVLGQEPKTSDFKYLLPES